MSLTVLLPALTSDDGGSALTGYQWRGGLLTSWATLPATETGPGTFSSLENGREYTFEVRAGE